MRGYQPGGRWERILHAIERHPLTLSELLRETGDARYSNKVERRKIYNALDAMIQQGLVVRLAAHEGFIATAHGVRTLREGEAAA